VSAGGVYSRGASAGAEAADAEGQQTGAAKILVKSGQNGQTWSMCDMHQHVSCLNAAA
jgi:hypothetical protein